MGQDTDLATIVRDIVQFLERLREVKLPSVLEDLRNDLLGRSKNALVACAATGTGPSSSPEPYLSMSPGNGSAARGLLLLAVKDRQIWKEEDPQEYVGAEEPREEKKESQQDYYETFHEVLQPEEAPPEPPVEQKRENIDTTLADIYYSFSAAQTKSKCTKCGPLRKGGKKLFLFEQHRECWAGLVGSHLLIYGTEKDNRPYMVQSVRGYTARAAPNAIPRDSKKSESTFELSSPGNKTLQFIARSPKDMEQWIVNISRVNDESKDNEVVTPIKSEDKSVDQNKENVQQETYQDVGPPKVNDSKEDTTISRGQLSAVLRDEKNNETETTDGEDKTKVKSPRKNANPPPLPARIPRRLPSLPHESSLVPSYCDGPEDEEEDDFYHRIEDFKDVAGYQNLPKKSSKKSSKFVENTIESYDDAESITKPKKVEKETKTKKEKRKSIEIKPTIVRTVPVEISEDIYDDVASVLRNENKKEEKVKSSGKEEEAEAPSYDDIQNVSVKPASKDQRRKQDKVPETTEEPVKSPQKKSFLDRVRSSRRQQSSGKAEKKLKSKTPTPPPIVTHEPEIPVYDDVSNLPATNQPETMPQEPELPEYNSPPPPRPVFTTPPTVPTIQVEEIYDDIGVVRRQAEEENLVKPNVTTANNSNAYMNGDEVNSRTLSGMTEEVEHYQSPRSSQPVIEQPEELYDDIAILADFKARQRELANKKAEESKILNSSPEKKPWNRRFVSSRKSKCIETIGDVSSVEINCQRSSSEIEDVDANPGEHSQKSVVRKNTFQKLINKMENSLGKTSSLASNKTSSTSDAT